MSFTLAHLDGSRLPPVYERPLAASSAFAEGAVLLVDSNGAYAECGADPAAIAAVALTPCGADTSGFNRLGTKEFPPGMMQGILVRDQFFHAQYVGTLPAASGAKYGIVKDSDGLWKVDFSDTTNLRVQLVSLEWTQSPLNRNRVLVRFTEANIQNI